MTEFKSILATSVAIVIVLTARISAAGYPDEPTTGQGNTDLTQSRQLITLQSVADEDVARARERAEVDPVGLMTALFQAADVHWESGDRAGAKARSDEAFKLYGGIPAADIDVGLNEEVWQFVNPRIHPVRSKCSRPALTKS